MRHALLAALLLVGCDDAIFVGNAEPITGVDGYEGVVAIVDAHCLGCHGAASPLGDLDLESDLHGAIVGVTGNYDTVIVEPGSPGDSMFFLKTSADSNVLGTEMPPNSGGLSQEENDIIANWIQDGAPAQ